MGPDIPAELVGVGSGGALLFAAVIWFSTRWLNRWTRTQDAMAETLVAIAGHMVEHNTQSTAILGELREARKGATEQSKALAVLLERVPRVAGGDS